MTTITSTQFQQNVGYYLQQAQRGETVFIKKLKPRGISFKLELIVDDIDTEAPENLVAKIRSHQHGFNGDGVAYQKKVRR